MSKRTTIIFFVLVCYIILQFLWWEILLVRQSNQIIEEKKHLAALSSSDDKIIMRDITDLENSKMRRVYMTVGEGTVFLLILLGGVYVVLKSIKKENELANQQNNFILSVSHELKTPIASTKLQIQTLLKHELEREKQLQLLHNALTESDRLQKLVDNILLVTQVENKNITANLSPLNFSSLIESTVHRYFEMYLDNEWLHLSIDPNIMIQGDKELLPSLIINLLENAIKYSHETLDVTVKLLKTDADVELLVLDKGCGISANEKEKVFEKFYRSGNEDVRKTKGTGIGLFIVKQIVQIHQAIITVHDNEPTGTIFKIKFKHA